MNPITWYIEHICTELCGEIDKSIFTVWYYDALFLVIKGTSRQEINNTVEDLKQYN